MHTDPLSDVKIVESWAKNALPWITAVREGRIESRRQVTDRAIVDAVLARSPRSALDVGCGEGWLVHELIQHGIAASGVDAIPELVKAARAGGGGDFYLMSYEQIAGGSIEGAFDAVVCNFSLLGKASVEGIFAAAPSMLNAHGSLIVQTLHPVAACGELPYRDGWRQGSWAGFGPDFSDPAPWYFRTLASWTRLFADSGLRLTEIQEPAHPQSGKTASVILIGEVAAVR